MTASRASIFAPPNALLMWTNGKDIFVEISGPEQSAIVAYPLTEGGLSKALDLLRQHADNAGTPLLARPTGLPPSHKAAKQAQAEAVLRKLGMIK